VAVPLAENDTTVVQVPTHDAHTVPFHDIISASVDTSVTSSRKVCKRKVCTCRTCNKQPIQANH